ncbi:MAG TPA: ATP-binding cassette domain-containing protein [Steroidobacteraceae bacterium]|nr:ATP-binding cassette domain-containing protein [Steroidobacteraceae bacterium]
MRVDLRDVGLTLGGEPILRRIRWSVRPGQRWVLVGRNGAGKTLLLKLLAGDVWPTPGRGWRRYYWRGERFDDPYGVKEQIAYVGAERQDRYEHYRWNHSVQAVVATGLRQSEIPLDAPGRAERRRIAALLARLRLQSLARRRFLTLSYGQRRLVLLARALAAAPRLLLLDELFNGLDASNRARARHCLRQLSRSRLPWVLSTHRSEEIPELATHRCELRAGRLHRRRLAPRRAARARRMPAEVPQPAARAAGTASRAARTSRHAAAPVLVRLRGVSVWRAGIAALRDVSLELRAGECWVVHGANGSGKSSLIQTVYGDLAPARGGAIERRGIGPGVPIAQFKRRAGLVAPELQALQPRYLRVADVVASGLNASIAVGGGAAPRGARVLRALRRAGATGLLHRQLRTLSYGQLRRVLFARALVREPDILLLDEPYEGLDAALRARLRALVDRSVRSGMTVLMATHHRNEWPAAATHELQLVRGRVSYCGPLRRRHAARPARRQTGPA